MVLLSFIDPELENLPPPPPPDGDPPPNAYKCELKAVKNNAPKLVYFHYDPVLQDIYISPLSKLQARPGTIKNAAGGPLQRITPPLHGSNVIAIARPTDFINSPPPLHQQPSLQSSQRSAFVNVPFQTSPSQLQQLVKQPPPQQPPKPQASTSATVLKIPSRPPSPTVPYPGGGTPSPPTTIPVVFSNCMPAKIAHRRISTPMLPQQYRRQMLPVVRSMPSFQQPPLSSAWDPLPPITQPIHNRPYGAALLPTPHIEPPPPKSQHHHHPGSPLLPLQAPGMRPNFSAPLRTWSPPQFAHSSPIESYSPRFVYRAGQIPPIPMPPPPPLQGQRHGKFAPRGRRHSFFMLPRNRY